MSKASDALGRLRYEFDNFISRGGGSFFLLFVVLFVLFVVVMFLLRLILSLFLPSGTHGVDSGPVESAIVAFLQTFDPGYMAGELSSNQWLLAAAVLAGLGGIVLVAILIAFTDTAFEERLARLRRGHSAVVEERHTLILGWDEQRVVEIIDELAIANERDVRGKKKRRDKVVVVLADQDKEYMDDYLKRHLATKSTRVVTRSGKPSDTADLEVVSAGTARSAILLSECSYAAGDAKKEQADARVLKTLLAVDYVVPEGKQLNVVVDLFRSKARRASRLVAVGSKQGSVEAIDLKNVLARILLQTSRSVGLSVVYEEMFSFDDAELYIANGDGLWTGMSFEAVSRSFTQGIPIGIRRAGKDDDKGAKKCVDGRVARPGSTSTSRVVINPPPLATVLEEGDQVIVLADDDSAIFFSKERGRTETGTTGATDRERRKEKKRGKKKESQLLIGWGPKTTRLLDEYVKYVDPRSTVHVMKRVPENIDPSGGIKSYAGHLDASVLDGDPTDPSTWDGIDPLVYDHIVILSDGDRGVSADVVDARTITILLLLREAIDCSVSQIKETTERESSRRLRNAIFYSKGSDDALRPTVVTELLESDNQVIAPNLDEHDFVISSRIVSMLFAQVSENPAMHAVYRALFQEEGSEVYIKPLDLKQLPSPDTDGKFLFSALMETAYKRDEICIGVKSAACKAADVKRDKSDKGNPKFGVRLNPGREESFELVEGDSLIVLAQSG